MELPAHRPVRPKGLNKQDFRNQALQGLEALVFLLTGSEEHTIKQRSKRPVPTSRKNRINDEITSREVRLIGADGSQVGVVAIAAAIEMAEKAELDLVEIAADAEPPVCRIMDYGKHIFEEKKRQTEARKKQKQIQVKEIKIRPGTEEGDYQVKLRNLKRFLDDGDKAKVTLRFRGREMAHQDIGLEMMRRIENDLEEYAVVEQAAKIEGRQMIMVLSPKKKK
ncbi:MAG TPA: translation initiation factor IF-3 [Dongiaceae bacterium]|nr:translation initiation factor IF-3 [Dongiaceae bacterium]